jgi:adenylate cyclase
MRGDYDGAELEARNALALSPNLADAHAVLGAALIFSGSPRCGLSSLDTCIRLDPRSPRLAVRLIQKAIGYYFCAEYKEAAVVAAQVARLYPKYPFPYRWLAAALGQLGQVDAASRALNSAITIAPTMFDMFVRRRVPWMRPEDHAHMVDGLRKAGLPE